MNSKKTVRWVVRGALLALVLAMAISGSVAAPPAQEPKGPEDVPCGTSTTCNMAGTALHVQNNGSGEAIYGNNASGGAGMGVRGRGNPGVYGTSVGAAGVRGVSVDAKGVKGESTNDDGVYASSINGFGLRAESENNYAVYGVSDAGFSNSAGVYGRNTGNGWGIWGRSAQSHGVVGGGGNVSGKYGGYFAGYGGVRAEATGPGYGLYASSSSKYAGYFAATASEGVVASGKGAGNHGIKAYSSKGYGVWSDTAASGGYGFYTGDKIHTGGGCVGCTSMIIAQNGGDDVLEMGDVVAVSGIVEPMAPEHIRPVLVVRRVDAVSSQSVVGVVEGRYVTEQLAEGGEDHARAAHTTTESAAPGDYLTIIYRGLAQVKVDTSASTLQVGQLLTSSDIAGHVMQAQAIEGVLPAGAIIGKALEPKANDQGLIWVLVDLQ